MSTFTAWHNVFIYPFDLDQKECTNSIIFSSNFDSGNLSKVEKSGKRSVGFSLFVIIFSILSGVQKMMEM